jgi:hypothetical protein
VVVVFLTLSVTNGATKYALGIPDKNQNIFGKAGKKRVGDRGQGGRSWNIS